MSPILSIHPAASQPVTRGQNFGEQQHDDRDIGRQDHDFARCHVAAIS
jgi:hypothetical protein